MRRPDGDGRAPSTTHMETALKAWRDMTERERALQYVQPALIGLIDGTISTLAPIFAAVGVALGHA